MTPGFSCNLKIFSFLIKGLPLKQNDALIRLIIYYRVIISTQGQLSDDKMGLIFVILKYRTFVYLQRNKYKV